MLGGAPRVTAAFYLEAFKQEDIEDRGVLEDRRQPATARLSR